MEPGLAGIGKDSGGLRRLSAIVVLILAITGLGGCGEQRAPQRLGTDGSPGYGGTVVIAAPNDLDYANTLVSQEGYTQEWLRSALFLPLIRYDADLGYDPVLAHSWEISGDTSVVFELRDDVRWHDGERTTAHDVAFTYLRAKDPETAFANRGYFEYWREVEVVDSFTVRFRIVPHADPLAGWAFTPIMPRHKLEAIPPARMRRAEFNKNPVGNGPFRFVSYRANDRWIFEANTDFPEALGGRPYLDRIVWRVVPENSAQVTELLAGGVDLIVSPTARQIIALEGKPGIRTIVRPSRKFQAIVWNGKRRLLEDPRVRRALAMAIDRREMLDVLRGGFGELATGPVYPAHWAFDRSLEPLPFDPTAARALLAEAGFHDRDGDGIVEDSAGNVLSLSITIPAGNEYNRNVAEMLQAYLAAVGAKLSLRAVDFATMIAEITSPERRFDATFLSWEPDFRLYDLADAFHSSALHGPFQLSSYSNAEVDSLLDRVVEVGDRGIAKPLWTRLQEILQAEQPWTPLFYTPDLFALSERVRGVEMDIRGAFVTVQNWWVVDEQRVALRENGGE